MEHRIHYSRLSRTAFVPIGMGQASSGIEVTATHLIVRMGWAFRAEIPLDHIVSIEPCTRRVIDRGVHGWRGRWIVNGSGKGLLTITIDPPVPATAVKFPITLRELVVSTEAPDELIEALALG